MKLMNITTDKQFASTIAFIAKGTEAVANSIHLAGLYALQQANVHGNVGFGVRLIEALGGKHDVKRVEKWLCHFGKFGMKEGLLVFRKRKDINETNLDAWNEKSANCPYWTLTPVEHHKFSVDYLTMLKGLLNKHRKAEALREEGKEAEEHNTGVLIEVEKLLAKFAPAEQPVNPAIATI